MSSEIAERAARLAQIFHETYERLAPNFGYQTRKASAVPWENVPENNKRLMIAVCAEVLRAIEESRGQRWIPVEEKLPSESGQYLVWIHGIGGSGEFIRFTTEAYFGAGDKHWIPRDGWMSHEVQGWQPLPDQPKGNENV